MATIDIKLKTYDELIFEITTLNTKLFLKDKEIERLNNIINELEEFILNHYIVGHTIQNASLDDILNKLKELKESE